LRLRTCTLLLFLLFANAAAAQHTTSLNISLFSPKKDSLNNISLELYRLPDSVQVTTQLYKADGNTFTVNTTSKYLIRISSVNFEPAERVISIADKPVSISIPLKRKTTDLQNVTVISKKPLITQEDDKSIIDAAVLASSSTNAYEVLEKTPGTIVDQDGNVYLNSMTPATIYINGREMKLSSEDIASLLKSLPAASVSKIEILRNPSAKYDAASSGGIINIVLKKGVKLGSSGTANIGYFQGVYSTQTAGFNLNKSSGKLTSYLSYQFTKRKNFEELNTDRLITKDTSFLMQKAYTTYPALGNYIGAGIDIAFTKKLNISYDTRININNNKSYAENSNDVDKLVTGAALSRSLLNINNRNNSLYMGNELSSTYKIDSLGSEWTVDLEYNYSRNRNSQDFTNYYYLPSNPIVFGDGRAGSRKNIFVAETELVLKLPEKLTIEAGIKLTRSNSNNKAEYFRQSNGSGRQIDSSQTNTFRYRETISSAYLQVAKTFWGFTLKPGLRLETTDINGRQIIPKDTNLSIRRTDLFPYVYLRHKLFKLFKTQLVGNAIFRRSIRRPYYEILNPYPKRIDEYLFDVGNPRLQPQFTTNYEVNVTFDDFPVLAFGINNTKNIFTNVIYQDDITKIAYRTYDNLGKSKEYYARILAGVPPGGKYFFYIGAQYNYIRYNGSYQSSPLNYSRGSWLFFMFQEFKATKTLTFNMQGFMRTKAIQQFYELDNFGGLFLSVNKSILKKKANIILSVNDVLRTNWVSFKLNQGTMSAAGSRVNDTRRFGITIRYNFGLSKPKEEKEFGAPVDN
jgi:iron complex outermembrane recepter protein